MSDSQGQQRYDQEASLKRDLSQSDIQGPPQRGRVLLGAILYFSVVAGFVGLLVGYAVLARIGHPLLSQLEPLVTFLVGLGLGVAAVAIAILHLSDKVKRLEEYSKSCIKTNKADDFPCNREARNEGWGEIVEAVADGVRTFLEN